MPLPYLPILNGSVKIAPFKEPRVAPYGPLTNSTPAQVYPIQQSITIHDESLDLHWPSAEHAFQAQKLLYLKSKLPANDWHQRLLTTALHQIENTKKNPKDEFLPSNDFEPILKTLLEAFQCTKEEFDLLCDQGQPNLITGGDPYALQFMRDVLKLKFDQNITLKELVMNCAREGIFPVKISHLDEFWASGTDGLGQNMLGIIILELGNLYLRDQGEKPVIAAPWQAYQQLKKSNLALSYDHLITYTANKHGWTVPAELHLSPTLGFFAPSKGHPDPLMQLIKTLNQFFEAEPSIIHDALTEHLKQHFTESPPHSSTNILSEIKTFVDDHSTSEQEKSPKTQFFFEAVQNPNTKKLTDLIEQLESTQQKHLSKAPGS